MKFRVKKQNLFWWPVTVQVPSDETPGAYDECGFEVRFEAIGKTEARKMDDETRAAGTAEAVELADVKLLVRVIKDWKGVEGEDGKDLAFTEDNLLAALEQTWTRRAIYAAYADAVSGKAARKN